MLLDYLEKISPKVPSFLGQQYLRYVLWFQHSTSINHPFYKAMSTFEGWNIPTTSNHQNQIWMPAKHPVNVLQEGYLRFACRKSVKIRSMPDLPCWSLGLKEGQHIAKNVDSKMFWTYLCSIPQIPPTSHMILGIPSTICGKSYPWCGVRGLLEFSVIVYSLMPWKNGPLRNFNCTIFSCHLPSL